MPKEKSLVETLREGVRDGIAPVKMYKKKPKELATFIPFIVPWENTPALESQEGMGAFGAKRNPHLNISEGHIKLKQVIQTQSL